MRTADMYSKDNRMTLIWGDGGRERKRVTYKRIDGDPSTPLDGGVDR
jgi:hypothetical protein